MKGTIQAKVKKAGGGQTTKGTAIPDVFDWSEPVECLYKANTHNNKGKYQDGNFTQSEYVITVQDQTFNATQVLLKDSRGNVVCEKQVQYLEVLETIQRVKITI